MDAILYIQTAREEMAEQQQQRRIDIIGQNGNDGQHYDSYDNTPEN